jgi:hypothetical protein
MFREMPMLGVSAMMLHHLIVTFKTVSVCQPVSLTRLAAKSASQRYLFGALFARCASCAFFVRFAWTGHAGAKSSPRSLAH